MCILAVAWLESATQDWLAEPCASHSQGTHGFSSSALTWQMLTVIVNNCLIMTLFFKDFESFICGKPQQVCSTQQRSSDSWCQLYCRGSQYKLHLLCICCGCPGWAISLQPSGWSSTHQPSHGSYTLEKQTHKIVPQYNIWKYFFPIMF